MTDSDQDLAMSTILPAHIAHLRDIGAPSTTIAARDGCLTRLHEALPYGLAWAAKDEIQHWLSHPGWARWTRLTYTSHIKAFYRWAVAEGYLESDPAVQIKRSRTPRLRPKPAADDELRQLLATLDEPWRTIVYLGAYAGLRCCEIALCRREHIDQTWIEVPHGKGGAEGTVGTHPAIWELVRDRPDGLLITNPWTGRPVTGLWITQRMAYRFNKIGLSKVRMHRLRHWCGTTTQLLTGDIRVTQEVLRHQRVTSTMGYTEVTDSRRRDAVAGLPDLTGQAPADR